MEQFCILNSNLAGTFLEPVTRDEMRAVICARLPPTESFREGESELYPSLTLSRDSPCHIRSIPDVPKLLIQDCTQGARVRAGRHVLDALLFVVYSHVDTLCVIALPQ